MIPQTVAALLLLAVLALVQDRQTAVGDLTVSCADTEVRAFLWCWSMEVASLCGGGGLR
jgi:hypothetical protein